MLGELPDQLLFCLLFPGDATLRFRGQPEGEGQTLAKGLTFHGPVSPVEANWADGREAGEGRRW